MTRKPFEEKLARLKRLERGSPSEDAIREIRRAISGGNSILMATAARTAAKLGLREAAPGIVSAFHRCMENPVQTEPGCHAASRAFHSMMRHNFRDRE